MISNRSRNKMRELRHRRLRKLISGTVERPRLAVFGSLKHIYAQVIDDAKGRTLVSASTMEQAFKEMKGTGNQEGGQTAFVQHLYVIFQRKEWHDRVEQQDYR